MITGVVRGAIHKKFLVNVRRVASQNQIHALVSLAVRGAIPLRLQLELVLREALS
jgi:hypothetical protein